MKKYSKEHQWIELADGGDATIGITRYAADELGEITFIELPESGNAISQGERLCTVESVKACSDVFMPAGGTVESVNTALEGDPAPLNTDPEGEGWICRVSNVVPAELDALMDAAQYRAFCDTANG